MISIEINEQNIATAALVVAIISALIARFSARQALKANRINILPVLALDISDEPRNTIIKLSNIGVGVAHNIGINTISVLTNGGTPSRAVYRITYEVPSKNYLSPGEHTDILYGKHPLAWYLKVSDEATVDLPIFYSDSIGTRYITVLRLGKGHIDIVLSPRKYGFARKIEQFTNRGITRLRIWQFNRADNDSKLKRER